MKDKSVQLARKSLEIERDAISDIIGYLDMESFSKAVDILSTCPKIITCASGSSGIAAKKFSHSLCCSQRNAQFLFPAEALHGGMGCIKKGDAVINVMKLHVSGLQSSGHGGMEIITTWVHLFNIG